MRERQVWNPCERCCLCVRQALRISARLCDCRVCSMCSLPAWNCVQLLYHSRFGSSCHYYVCRRLNGHCCGHHPAFRCHFHSWRCSEPNAPATTGRALFCVRPPAGPGFGTAPSGTTIGRWFRRLMVSTMNLWPAEVRACCLRLDTCSGFAHGRMSHFGLGWNPLSTEQAAAAWTGVLTTSLGAGRLE